MLRTVEARCDNARMHPLVPTLRRLGLLLIVFCCSFPGMAGEQTWLQIDKSARTLTLFEGEHAVLEYPIALGRNPIGAKRQQGDGKTPEGRYFIRSRLRASRFHLALEVSYPSLADQMLADALGVPAGGQIMIHGIGPNAPPPAVHHPLSDWTDGCIAVTDAQIEVLWDRVPVGTPVDIRP